MHQERAGRAHRTNLWLSLAGAVHILLGRADSNDWRERKAGSLTDLNAATRSSYPYDAKAEKLYLKIVSVGYEWE